MACVRVGSSLRVHLPVSPWPAVSMCHVRPGAGELWPRQAGITRAHGDLGKHMPACCSLPEHQAVVPHSLSGELSLVSPGDVPHCCPPSYSVCPGQGAAHLSSGFSPGVEVGQEGERADGAGVLPASFLCSLVFNYVLKPRQTFLVLQFPLVSPKCLFHFAHEMAWNLE